MSKERITRVLREVQSTLVDACADDPYYRSVLAPVFDAMALAADSLTSPPASDGTEAVAARVPQRISELKEAVAARDQFITTIGYELRNPLSPLSLQLEHLTHTVKTLPDGLVPASWLVPRLEIFTRRIHGFLEVLNRIVDVSRICAGTLSLQPEELDLTELVRHVCTRFERELAIAHSKIHISADEHVPGTWDRLRLEQICSHLLSNAIRYGAGQPVEISIHGDQSSAVLTVRDHGIGLSEEAQQRVFHRLERVDLEPRTGGLGIGLWTVHNLCVAMGGSVRVQSRAGEGATFTVTLPRSYR